MGNVPDEQQPPRKHKRPIGFVPPPATEAIPIPKTTRVTKNGSASPKINFDWPAKQIFRKARFGYPPFIFGYNTLKTTKNVSALVPRFVETIRRSQTYVLQNPFSTAHSGPDMWNGYSLRGHFTPIPAASRPSSPMDQN
jgi:hypothetical protein